MLKSLLVEEEFLLLHDAFHVVLDRIAGIHLLELRQEPVPESRFGGRRRPYIQPDQRLEGRACLLGPARKSESGNRGEAEENSRHGMTPGKQRGTRS